MRSKYEFVENKKSGFYQDNDPFFASAGQKPALSAIDQVIHNKIDLLLLAGDEGTGKSRLLEESLEDTPNNLLVARVSGAHDYPESFLRNIMFGFEQNPAHEDVEALFNDLVDYLLGQHQTGQETLLVVDDAHQLTADSVDLIKALSELESREESMLKIVLSSTKSTPIYHKLTKLTEDPSLRSAVIEVESFSERESREYTLQLLSHDPATSNLKLTTTGGRRIHYYSGGNPALIAFLTRVASSITIGSGQSQISRKIVQRAIRSPKWVEISESITGIHNVKIPGSDERGQHATPKVITYKDGERLSEHELSDEKIWLGRDPSSSIQLPGASVSRRHALVTREGDTIWISNLNSINGTQVNSKPVLRRVLLDGDVIRIANYLLLFIYEEAAKSSGHLKQVEDPSLELNSPANNSTYTDNYIELPDSNEEPLLDLEYATAAPIPPDNNRKTVFAIGTIASIALITAAIMMSKKDGDVAPLATPDAPSAPAENLLDLPQINAPSATTSEAVQSLDMPSSSIMNGRPADLPMPFTMTEGLPATIETFNQNATTEYSNDSFSSDSAYLADNVVDSRIEAGSFSPEAGFSDLAFGESNTSNYSVPQVDTYSSYSQNDAIIDSNSYSYSEIEDLLQQANRQLSALKLSVPEGDNAYESYNQVLAMDPSNPEAQQGINDVVDRYESLARANQKRGNTRAAIRMTDRGLAIQPWHQGLNTLRSELANAPQNTRSTRSVENRHNIAKATDAELESLYSQLPHSGISEMSQAGAIQPLNNVDQFYPNGLSAARTSQGFSIKPIPTDAKPLPSTTVNSTRYDPAPSMSYSEPVMTQMAPLASLPVLAPAQPIQTYTQSQVTTSPQQRIQTAAPLHTMSTMGATRATTLPTTTFTAPVAVAPSIPVAPTIATAPATAAPVTATKPVPQAAATAVATTPKSPIPNYLAGGKTAQQVKPTATPISAETIMSVDHLLKQANSQQKSGHFTGPSGDNALETYKRILALEPMNPDAMIGLLDIADYYYRESEKLLLLGDPLSSLAMIEEGLRVRPDHRGLRQLQTNAQLLLQKDGARTLYGKPMTTAQKKDAKIDNQIDKIIHEASNKLNEEEFSRALSMVEQGLTLDPQNPQLISIRTRALKSLTELEDKWGQQEKLREQNLARQQRVKYEINEMKAQRLLQEARKQFVKGNYQGAMAATSRGLEVMPENVELLALRAEVQKTWDKQTSNSAAKAVNNIVTGLVAKATKLRQTGKNAEAMRVVENGLAIDPGNRDLEIMRLEIQRALQG